MTMRIRKTKHYTERGIVLLPIVIAVAVLVLVGGGGIAIYEVQKNNNSENEQLRQKIEALEQEHPLPTPTLSPEVSSTPSVDPAQVPTPTPKPAGKSATTSAPTPIQPTAIEPSLPLIIEQEFEKVYGRKPSSAESNMWKSKYRANSWSRSDLHNALVASKPQPATIENTSSTQSNKSSAVSIELCKTNSKTGADKMLSDALAKSPMFLELTASTKIRDIEQAALKYGIISQSEVPDITSIYNGFKNSGASNQEAQQLTQTALSAYNSWLGDIQDNAQAQLNALRAKRDKAEEQLYSKCLSSL